ncbi:MAG: TRAP transporter large permease [Comamonadaceae bacterium]|nr:MAG: TRAP transporter large permease [Comamonadaceae bacterium]
MTPELQIIVVFAVFLALLAAGMAVPFAISVPALLYLLLLGGTDALKGLGLVSWGSMNSFSLTAIPLFILMAELMERSGLSIRTYRGLARLVCVIPGGLLQTNIAGCALFSAISGSSVATAAAIGGVALPQLETRKYSPALSAGSLAAGGTLGILIPPSIAMIVYGTFTETSVARLFMAGVVPGLMLTALFMAFIAICALVKPEVAPRERGPQSLGEFANAMADLLPLTALVACIMGSLYFGFATPTEAAALGCVFVLMVARIWGTLDWGVLRSSLRTTTLVSGNIMFIVFAAFIFSYAISMGGVGEKLTAWLVELKLTRTEFMFAMLILFTVLGAFVESLGIIVITVPLLYPVLLQFGFDPVWFGIVVVLFIEMGQITPPIGINLFVIQGMWNGKLSDVVRGSIPFHLLMFVMLGLLVLWPDIALWLPRNMTAK